MSESDRGNGRGLPRGVAQTRVHGEFGIHDNLVDGGVGDGRHELLEGSLG